MLSRVYDHHRTWLQLGWSIWHAKRHDLESVGGVERTRRKNSKHVQIVLHGCSRTYPSARLLKRGRDRAYAYVRNAPFENFKAD